MMDVQAPELLLIVLSALVGILAPWVWPSLRHATDFWASVWGVALLGVLACSACAHGRALEPRTKECVDLESRRCTR